MPFGTRNPNPNSGYLASLVRGWAERDIRNRSKQQEIDLDQEDARQVNQILSGYNPEDETSFRSTMLRLAQRATPRAQKLQDVIVKSRPESKIVGDGDALVVGGKPIYINPKQPTVKEPRTYQDTQTIMEDGKLKQYRFTFDETGEELNKVYLGEGKPDKEASYSGRDMRLSRIIDKFNADPNTRKQQQVINSAEQIIDLIESGNPVAAASVPTFMARASGEVGNLSEADKAPFGGSRALLDKMAQVAKTAADGTLTEDNAKFVREVAGLMKRRGFDNVRGMAKRYSKQYSKTFKDVPEQDIYMMLNPELDEEQPAQKDNRPTVDY